MKLDIIPNKPYRLYKIYNKIEECLSLNKDDRDIPWKIFLSYFKMGAGEYENFTYSEYSFDEEELKELEKFIAVKLLQY